MIPRRLQADLALGRRRFCRRCRQARRIRSCRLCLKSEIRSTKSETNPKSENPVTQIETHRLCFEFRFWLLGFVSDFGFRVSDFEAPGFIIFEPFTNFQSK